MRLFRGDAKDMKFGGIILNEYVNTMSSPNFDVEKRMEQLEDKLVNTGGECFVGAYPNKMRFLRLYCKNEKLTHYGEGINFEAGLKDFFDDLDFGSLRKFKPRDENISETASSPIDLWLLNGHAVNIRAEKFNSGHTYCVSAKELPSKSIRSLVEVNSRRLVSAFEWFNEVMKSLNELDQNPIAKVMCGNGLAFEKYKTLRCEVQDNLTLEMWGL